MKKTLLATAIAGAMCASAAQAATIYNQDGTQLDLYGNLQTAYKSVNNAEGNSEDEIFDNGSTFGVKGQHVINPGLTGYFKAEWEFNADEAKGSDQQDGISRSDQVYMGLQGNFGDARVGSWDTLIDDWVQDPVTNNEFFDVTDSPVSGDDGVNTQNTDTDREGDKIQYMSPVFGGLQFAVGAQYKGDAEAENVDSDGNAAFFGGAKYTMGAFSVAGVYDSLDNYDGEITGDIYDTGPEAGEDFDAGDQYGITAEYTMEQLQVALKYERYESGDDDYLPDENRFGLGSRYGYGYGDVYAAYQYVDLSGGDAWEAVNDDDSRNEIVLGATYNISPAMYTFIEGAWYDRNQDAGDGVAVGAVYSF